MLYSRPVRVNTLLYVFVVLRRLGTMLHEVHPYALVGLTKLHSRTWLFVTRRTQAGKDYGMSGRTAAPNPQVLV